MPMPKVRARAKPDDQRSRGIDRERSGGESQQRMPGQQAVGDQVADDAPGRAAESDGDDFTNHK